VGQVVGDGGTCHACSDDDNVWLERLNGSAEIVERGHWWWLVWCGMRMRGQGGRLEECGAGEVSEAAQKTNPPASLSPLPVDMCGSGGRA